MTDPLRDVAIARWLGIVVIASSLVWCASCTTSQLRTHAHAASLSRASLDLGAAMGEGACSPERSARMAREGVSASEHTAHVRRCEHISGAHALAVAAWRGYVAAVLSAAETGRVSMVDVLTWASRLATVYQSLSEALARVGVDAPRLPAALGGDR